MLQRHDGAGALGLDGGAALRRRRHAGRLARWLRALGYDTLYFRDAPDRRLLAVALAERRRLLTRDVALALRAHEAGLLVRAEELDLQIREVTVACGLASRRALSRCLECNGALVSTTPAAVRDRVPPYTFATCREFWLCSGCGRVFWAGTHVAGIRRRLEPYLGGSGDLTGGSERRPP